MTASINSVGLALGQEVHVFIEDGEALFVHDADYMQGDDPVEVFARAAQADHYGEQPMGFSGRWFAGRLVHQGLDHEDEPCIVLYSEQPHDMPGILVSTSSWTFVQEIPSGHSRSLVVLPSRAQLQLAVAA